MSWFTDMVATYWAWATELTAYLTGLFWGPFLGAFVGAAIVDGVRWLLTKKTGLPVLTIGKRKPKDEE
jgi:hypothetical protein